MMVREPRFPFPFLEFPGLRRPPTGPAPIRRQPKGRRERHEEFVMAVRALVTVIDDDESVRESLPELLRAFGFVVRAFSSAEEFLASNCVGQTRCLILDIVMPGMTGPDLQRELKLRRRRCFGARIAGIAGPMRGLAGGDVRVRAGVPGPSTSQCAELPGT